VGVAVLLELVPLPRTSKDEAWCLRQLIVVVVVDMDVLPGGGTPDEIWLEEVATCSRGGGSIRLLPLLLIVSGGSTVVAAPDIVVVVVVVLAGPAVVVLVVVLVAVVSVVVFVSLAWFLWLFWASDGPNPNLVLARSISNLSSASLSVRGALPI
jgi:hypothetical protein